MIFSKIFRPLRYDPFNGEKTIDPAFHTQFTAPSNFREILPMDDIERFVGKCSGYLTTLNFAGDFYHYPEKDRLWKFIEIVPAGCNLYITFSSWMHIRDAIRTIVENPKVRLTVIVDNRELFKEAVTNLSADKDSDIGFSFPISSEQEYEEALQIVENHNIESFTIIPVFNGKNLDFFEKYVFTSQEEIAIPNFCKREIFANQVINSNFFGELTITPDGKVYANINNPSLGTMQDALYDLVFNEMDSGRSWRMIRNQGPCPDCLYQWLCPSPSNYEIVMKRPNLCLMR